MPTRHPPAIVWWLVWAAILGGFLTTYAVFLQLGALPGFPRGTGLVALAPMAASAFIRIAKIPRASSGTFVHFIIGIALAEAGGITGIILGGGWKVVYAAAAIVLIITYIPAFIRIPPSP